MLLIFTALRIPCTDLLDPPSGFEVEGSSSVAVSLAAFQKVPAMLPPRDPFAPAGPLAARPSTEGLVKGLIEQSSYDVRYGFLGSVGQLRLSASPLPAEPGGVLIVRIVGQGEGDVLGLGRFERTIETEFDVEKRTSRRWRSTRHSSGLTSNEMVSDSAVRHPGDKLSIERRKGTGDAATAATLVPTSAEILVPASTTSDPLGLVWRLRGHPPAEGETQVLQMMDGMALWRVEVKREGSSVPVPDSTRRGVRLAALMTPVLYNGQRDAGRPERHFTLWLEDAPGHLPLRLEMPLGVASAVLTLKEPRPPDASSSLPSSSTSSSRR